MTVIEKRSAVIAEARKHIGVKENPPGTNIVLFNDWFYGVKDHDGAWCGTSLSYIFHHAGCPLGRVDFMKGIAGVPFALKQVKDPNAKRKWGTIIKPEDVQPGDIAIVDWKGDGIPDHITLVENPFNIKTTGEFCTLEGNTSDKGSQSHGGEFMEKKRNINRGNWTFVRPAVYDIV